MCHKTSIPTKKNNPMCMSLLLSVTYFLLTDVNECEAATPPCENGGTCVNDIGDYHCECPPEWTGKNCRTSMYIFSLLRVLGELMKPLSGCSFMSLVSL